VKGDSQLIIRQVKGKCYCNDPQLATYLLHAHKLEKDFEVLDLHHIPRMENAVADDLSTKAPTRALVPDRVFKRQLQQPIARLAEPDETSTSKLVDSAALIPWSPPRIVGITKDSVHPSAQDPKAQVSPDA
jgi:hypothetical protein